MPILAANRQEDAIDVIFDGLVFARWVHFTSMVVVFGGSLFWLYMGRERALATLPWTARTMGRIILAAALAAALSGIAWLVATIANMTGDIDQDILHAFFLETLFGPVAVVRLSLLTTLVALAVLYMTSSHYIALATVSGLLLVSQAWLGHAAEDGGTLYGGSMIVSYAVHVLAGAAWLGGLVPLGFAVIEQTSLKSVLRLLMRFSGMASGAVAIIVVSGVANSAFRIGIPTVSMISSPYLRMLFVKVGVVMGMLMLAGFNRFVLMPGLERTWQRPPLSAVTASIVAESILGILVLGAAALLGVTSPPR